MSEATRTRAATVACPLCATLNRVDLGRIADGPKCGKCRSPIPLDRPLILTDATFPRVVADAPVPLLVDFHADWCGPCKAMAPVLEQLARERAGSALVAKLDTDRNPGVAARFRIGAIPTLVAFSGGREVAREVGAVPRQRLEALLARAGAG